VLEGLSRSSSRLALSSPLLPFPPSRPCLPLTFVSSSLALLFDLPLISYHLGDSLDMFGVVVAAFVEELGVLASGCEMGDGGRAL